MELRGKKVLFLGSSVTYGEGAVKGISFADYMAERCGLTMIKEAVSGTTLADIDERSYVSRLKKLPTDIAPDLFICQLSTNDAGRAVDYSLTRDAICFVISYAKKTYGCPIVFYTGTYFKSERYGHLVSMLHEIAEEQDIHVLDMWNDPEMRAIGSADYTRYMLDGVHPSLEGYSEWWTPRFIEFCEKL